MCPPENGKNKNTSLCWTDLLGTIKKKQKMITFFSLGKPPPIHSSSDPQLMSSSFHRSTLVGQQFEFSTQDRQQERKEMASM